jgi:phosphomannomutase
MPEISRFFGIIIAMFYDEHNPPHFHVRYNEHKAEIGIQPFHCWQGSYFPVS